MNDSAPQDREKILIEELKIFARRYQQNGAKFFRVQKNGHSLSLLVFYPLK